MGVGKRYDSMGLGGRVDSEQLVVGSEERSSGRESERAEPFPTVAGSSGGGPLETRGKRGKRAKMAFGKHGRA